MASLRSLPARTPLRVTLVAAMLSLVALALVATGLTVTAMLRGYLVGQVDEDLARGPGPLTGPGPRAPGNAGDAAQVSPFAASRAEYLRATLPNGRIAVEDSSDPDGPQPLLPASSADRSGETFTVPSDGGGPDWRVRVSPERLRGGRQLTVVHAISLSDVEDTVNRLELVETGVGLIVLVLLGGAGYVVVRTSLRPLEEVEHTAAAIAAGDLSRRVPERDPRTEVGRLSVALNGMLAQIESAFRSREASEAAARASAERMRRFVADASHELRTPLTSIRGFAELYRQGAVTGPDEVTRVMKRVEDEAARMGLLVDDLLLLARLDQARPLERRPVDLLAIATDAVHDAKAVAPDRAVDLVVSGDAGAPVVTGDEARLRQVVGNLVSNALTHTPAGTPVTVAVGTAATGVIADGGPTAYLSVRDHGPGLAPDVAERVFERFYRADVSRSRAAGGSGLGLSIVAALVAAHGGRVRVETEPGQGATFRVDLPLTEDAGESTSPADPVSSEPTGG